MEDGAKLYGKQKLAGIKNDLNKRLLSRLQASQKIHKRLESSKRELGMNFYFCPNFWPEIFYPEQFWPETIWPEIY